MSRRRSVATLLAILTALTMLGAVPIPAAAATTSVTLVGSLQDELGCAADWDPDRKSVV